MSRLIVVIQEKGGVGKTCLSVHLTSFLRSQGHNYRPVDFDHDGEGVIIQVFPDGASVSPNVPQLRNGESRFPELMERVLDGQLFLIDCGANTGAAWDVLFSEVWPDLHQQLAAKEVKTTLIVPVTIDPKTANRFERYRLWPDATLIMVRVKTFAGQELVTPDHPAELTIDLPLAPPKLFTTYMTKRMTFDAIAASQAPALSIDRAFARGYLPQLHASFRKILPHLKP